MTALRAHGFGLALDDFGAGASNIDRLRNYPFTEVKIDPAFIRLAMDEAFAKAAAGDATALPAFAALLGQDSGDGLVGFHLKRLLAGATGISVALD